MAEFKTKAFPDEMDQVFVFRNAVRMSGSDTLILAERAWEQMYSIGRDAVALNNLPIYSSGGAPSLHDLPARFAGCARVADLRSIFHGAREDLFPP